VVQIFDETPYEVAGAARWEWAGEGRQPTLYVISRIFGSFTAAVEAAGPSATAPPHLHDR